MYNSEKGTFFTLVGELGLALYEMYEVSTLSMGEVTYEEYIPTTEELSLLKARDEQVYGTYWEIMCHYRIYADLAGVKNQGIGHKKWAEYLFLNFKESLPCVCGLKPVDTEEINRHIAETGAMPYTTESNEGGFTLDTIFKAYITKHSSRYLIGV